MRGIKARSTARWFTAWRANHSPCKPPSLLCSRAPTLAPSWASRLTTASLQLSLSIALLLLLTSAPSPSSPPAAAETTNPVHSATAAWSPERKRAPASLLRTSHGSWALPGAEAAHPAGALAMKNEGVAGSWVPLGPGGAAEEEAEAADSAIAETCAARGRGGR